MTGWVTMTICHIFSFITLGIWGEWRGYKNSHSFYGFHVLSRVVSRRFFPEHNFNTSKIQVPIWPTCLCIIILVIIYSMVHVTWLVSTLHVFSKRWSQNFLQKHALNFFWVSFPKMTPKVVSYHTSNYPLIHVWHLSMPCAYFSTWLSLRGAILNLKISLVVLKLIYFACWNIFMLKVFPNKI